MSYLERLSYCDNADLRRFLPFYGLGGQLGWVREDRTLILQDYPDVFVVGGRRVDLHGALFDYENATDMVACAVESMRENGHISGWRGERYAVKDRFKDSPKMSIERAAVSLLGVKSWGFHLNAYVRRPDGLYLWIATRAEDRPMYPGKLDNTVAGGQPEGLTLAQNLVKECAEEASLPADIALQARPVGAMSYRHETEAGLKQDELFCFDLELPEDIVPTPSDGEVKGFQLLPVEEVMGIVRDTDRFKFNCAPVLIHFFLRHGLLHPDNERDYAQICAAFNPGSRPSP